MRGGNRYPDPQPTPFPKPMSDLVERLRELADTFGGSHQHEGDMLREASDALAAAEKVVEAARAVRVADHRDMDRNGHAVNVALGDLYNALDRALPSVPTNCPECHHAAHVGDCGFVYDQDEPDFGVRAGQRCYCSSAPTPDEPTCAHVFEEVTDGEAYIDTCVKCGTSAPTPAEPTDR